MKLTLELMIQDGQRIVYWNGTRVEVEGTDTSRLPSGLYEAECRYVGPSRFWIATIHGPVTQTGRAPGFDAYARARRASESQRPEEALAILASATELPLDGLIFHSMLGPGTEMMLRILTDVATHPDAAPRQVEEVARRALRAGVDAVSVRELIGDDLESPEYTVLAAELMRDVPLDEAPTWWIEGIVTAMIERAELGYNDALELPDDDAVWESEFAGRLETLSLARARGIRVRAGVEADLRAHLERERAATRAATSGDDRDAVMDALQRLEAHHRVHIPEELRAAWTSEPSGGGRAFAFLSLKDYFADSDYGALARLEAADLWDGRHLVFGEQPGVEGPPYFALAVTRPGMPVLELWPGEAPTTIAPSLSTWPAWSPGSSATR